METALGEAFYRVTVSPYDVGMLVVLRPLPPAEEKRHPFSNAVYRMRECLSNFTAVQFRMKRVLQEHHLLAVGTGSGQPEPADLSDAPPHPAG